MPKIFLSFRRSDSPGVAGRIFDRLTSRFGAHSVFMDIQFAPGAHFPEQLQNIVDGCDLVLAIVGPEWRGARHGRKRAIDNEFDLIRLEIETTLRAQKTLIPLLVGGAVMPSPKELPESLRNFSYLNAVRIDAGRDFSSDVDRLIRMIDELEGVKAHLRSLQSGKGVQSLEQRSDVGPTAASAHQDSMTSNKIVLSYRRSDSAGVAGRLFDHLEGRFGRGSVFMDIDSIPFGINFRAHVENAVQNCKVVIVIVGRKWMGKRFWFRSRIFDSDDPVRIEIETALRKHVPIIPVLLKGADMPKSSDLPSALKEFCDLNGPPLDPEIDFRQHAERIISSVERFLK